VPMGAVKCQIEFSYNAPSRIVPSAEIVRRNRSSKIFLSNG
jgi:hypothetical protein